MKSSTHPNPKFGLTAAFLSPCLATFLLLSPVPPVMGQAAPLSLEKKETSPMAATNTVAPGTNAAPTFGPPAPSTPAAPAAPATPPAAAPTTPPTNAVAKAPDKAAEEIQLSFQGAAIDMIAQWLAQTTGKSVVKSPKVQCQLTIMSSKKVTPREAVNTVYRALSLEGFSVTETANSILIGTEGQEPKMSPELLAASGDVPEGKQRLVKVFTLQHTQPTDMSLKVKGVLSDKAIIDVDDRAGRLIITDYNDNINQAKNLISLLDTENPSEISVHVIPLKRMNAQDLAREVSPLVRRGRGQRDIVEILANDQANALIVICNEAGFKNIEKIINSLDTPEPSDLAVRVLPIKHMNVYALARAASPLYLRLAGHGTKDMLEVSINDQSNSLIILSSEATYKAVEKIVSTLDTEEPGDIAVRVIPLKHMDAATLANQIAPLCRRLGGRGPSSNIDMVADYQSNSLIVLSCEADYQSVLKIVNSLDTDDRGDLAIRTIPLKNVNAYTLVRTAAPFYQRLAGRGRKEVVEISVNDQNNSLLVFSSEANFKAVEKIVATLDTEQPGAVAVRVIGLKHMDAATLAQEISPLCRRIGVKGQNNTIELVADYQSNSLIVLSCESDFQMVQKVVESLDTQDHGDVAVRTIILKHINAYTMVRAAAPFYQRLAGRGRKDIIEVTVNEQNNSLVILSSDANFKAVEKVVATLDTEEPGGVAVRVISLKNIDAPTLAQEIAPLCRRVGGKGQNAIDLVADAQSNALIVLSCEADYQAVQKIVASLDTDDHGDMAVRVIALKHVSAQQLVREVGPLCARMNGKGQKDLIDVAANDTSNTLIVLSSEANFKSLEKIVSSLDVDNRQDLTAHVIPLNHVNAIALAREVAPICMRLSGKGQKDFIDITANEQSNSLIVLANDSNFQAIEDIIVALDTEKPEDVAIRSIPLKYVNAQDLAREVGPLCQRMSGRGQKDVIEVTANDKSNSLMVLSSESNFHSIQKIVAGLDADNRGDVAVRVIVLKHMNAQDLAREVAPLYQRMSGKEMSAKGQKDVIEVTANDRSNSLIILSTEANFKAIESLIVGLDTSEAQEKAMKIFPLVNADAQDVARQLETLFQDQDTTSSRYPFYYFGGGNRNANKKMSVVADRRRNSLIIQAPPVRMESIEAMIKTLDEALNDDSLAPKIYPLKYVSAGDIEDILNELFLKKSTQRSYWNPFFDEGDSSSTADRDVGRLYGKVRITSEPHANAIIITANSSENLVAVEAVLKQLDRPSEAGETTLRVPLKFAKASNVANSINILFARGGAPVLRPPPLQGQANPAPQQQNGNSPQNNFELELDAKEDGYYPWLGGQQEIYSRANDRNGIRPVSDLVGRVRVVADQRSNALLVSANMHFFPQIVKLIDEMDAPTAQVMIEAKIVEVSSDYLDKLGVRWSPDGNKTFTADDFDNSLLVKNSAINQTEFGRASAAIANATHSGVINSTLSLDFLIQFLRKTTDASVLASPQINIADNEMGRLFVGSQVPFIDKSLSTDVGSLNQSFSYKNVGIILEVTPHINIKGDVALRIRAESSAIEPGQTLFGGAILDTRNFRTDLTAKDGETLVLGGIIQKQVSNTIRKVPLLGDIPYLGYLFKKKDTLTRDVELMVFLRPRVVRNPEQAKEMLEDMEKKAPLVKKWQDENDSNLLKKNAKPAKK